MTKTKKLMNTPEAIIPEMIDGLLGAHPDILRPVATTGRVVMAVDGPRRGKVGIVVGGGSGHEPAFAGYVGRGLADAAVIGNVFASPSPVPIAEAARAVDGGVGVVFLYGNYTGDVMNFDMAAEAVARESIDVRSIQVADDVASAPAERRGERRGIAGDFFVFKAAGAMADRMASLDEVERVTRKANHATATMGVALGACSLPQTLKPNFEIGDDEMEIGMGVHGEPGIRRGKVESADAVGEALTTLIVEELALSKGDRVAVLVNGLGATSLMELYLLHRRSRRILHDRGVTIHRSFVGEYVTSLDMAGASITLMKLDDELADLLDHPCYSVALKIGSPPAPVAADQRLAPAAARRAGATEGTRGGAVSHRPTGEITAAIFVRMIEAVAEAIEERSAWLSELDGAIGDGDHGVTMSIGWRAVRSALAGSSPEEDIEAICHRVAKAFLDAVGASSGPLYASAFVRGGEAVSGRDGLDAAALVAFLEAAARGISARGNAAPGDKTMLDAWLPAAEGARAALTGGADVSGCLRAAVAGAERGMKATADIVARRGRSAKLGKRSLGHIDPGAASSFVIIDALSGSFDEQTRERA
jgi:dihydroxyacetone kinase phosphoprotein-dependent L subunit